MSVYLLSEYMYCAMATNESQSSRAEAEHAPPTNIRHQRATVRGRVVWLLTPVGKQRNYLQTNLTLVGLPIIVYTLQILNGF